MTALREACQGRWRGILPILGISPDFLTGRQRPCPICGGKDRFRFTDREGLGMGYCNQCGAMDGIRLVELFNGWDFRRTAREIESVVGDIVATKAKPAPSNTKFIRRLWEESRSARGTAAQKYLAARGLEMPETLRFHPACPISNDEVKTRPAMLGPVRAFNGDGVAFHRTYLLGNAKAPIECPRQVIGKLPEGSAIRLYEADDVLGVAEGIESAIGAKMKFRVPTWACISNGGLERFILPDTVKSLYIFGDADANFVGQSSAYRLAARMAKEHPDLKIAVCIPDMLGTDWADKGTNQ